MIPPNLTRLVANWTRRGSRERRGGGGAGAGRPWGRWRRRSTRAGPAVFFCSIHSLRSGVVPRVVVGAAYGCRIPVCCVGDAHFYLLEVFDASFADCLIVSCPLLQLLDRHSRGRGRARCDDFFPLLLRRRLGDVGREGDGVRARCRPADGGVKAVRLKLRRVWHAAETSPYRPPLIQFGSALPWTICGISLDNLLEVRPRNATPSDVTCRRCRATEKWREFVDEH